MYVYVQLSIPGVLITFGGHMRPVFFYCILLVGKKSLIIYDIPIFLKRKRKMNTHIHLTIPGHIRIETR